MGSHHSPAWEDIGYTSATRHPKASEKKRTVNQTKKDIAGVISDMLDVAREQQNPNSYKTKEHFFFHNIDSIISYMIRNREPDNPWEILKKGASGYGMSQSDVNAIIIYKNTIGKIKNANAPDILRNSCIEIKKIARKEGISFDKACKLYWDDVGKNKYNEWNIRRFDGLKVNSIPFLLLMQIVKKYDIGDENF